MGEKALILELLFNLIVCTIDKYVDDSVINDNLYLKIQSEGIPTEELLEKSDQDIDDFIKSRETDIIKQKKIFDIFQSLKIEKSIDTISSDIKEEANQKEKNLIYDFFSSVIEPDKIEISNNEVKISYNFSEDSSLRKEINSINMWHKDNVVDTLSNKLHINTENITIINTVSEYIDFICNFEETSYISRGQKDCTYDLKPSLHRIFKGGYKNHSSQYESAFKQKVLYYDNSVETKDSEELRAYAQHFGLPTNYLDFTEAHLISLLFAVEEFDYIKNHSIVYFVDALSYNREVIKDEIKLVDFSDKNLKKTKEDHYADKSYFIRVGNSNERIHFQKGCFLKVEPNDSLANMYKNFTKIVVIDKDYKESILKELFGLGITFENIYPDKDNMVKTIKFLKEHIE